MMNELLYVSASERELNELLEGRSAGYPITWRGRYSSQRLSGGEFGVLWREPRSKTEPVRPLTLVSPPEEMRRLFGRMAQLRPDLSPISAWCHVLPPARFAQLDEPTRPADLIGLEAAWTGVSIAEALLLSERTLSKLRLAACLATQSFAIARTVALWESATTTEILDRYDAANKLMRTGGSGAHRLRASLMPVWAALVAATSVGTNATEHRNVVEAIQALIEARAERPNEDEGDAVYRALRSLPEAEFLRNLQKLTPEARVKEFDQIIRALSKTDTADAALRNELCFLAGYLATVVAGGAPSLAMAEDISQSWPAVTAWAYAIGGLGERRTWTSSFDGLGRLVARELSRPLRLDEPPTCDFALDEAVMLVDPQLSDPLVHLRIKQMRVVTVSLLPGVNVSISLAEPVEPRRSQPEASPRQSAQTLSYERDFLAGMADALWPYLEPRIAGVTGGTSSGSKAMFKRNKKNPQQKLPLDRDPPA